MDEASARAWIARQFDVSRETLDRLEVFVAFLKRENEGQNLISRSTLDHVWDRHVIDSAQLLRWDDDPEGAWLDLGTGAGFPGLVVAALRPGPTTLVEQRRLRVDFLRQAIEILELADRCEVVPTRVERMPPRPFAVISARAFAPLPELLVLGERFSTTKTRWVLPKGRNAQSELEAAQASWQGDFRLEPSLTDADARIIVAQGVRRRSREKHRG